MTRVNHCRLLGAPVGSGAGVRGCELGPAALRQAGLADALRARGWQVTDLGDARPEPGPLSHPANPALRYFSETTAWIRGIGRAAQTAGRDGALPVFLGGDHALSAATVPAMARRARAGGRPLFVLWLDAHPDFHTLDSSTSGNLHGTPVAYFTGAAGFTGFPPLRDAVAPRRVCMMGLRSIDADEAARLAGSGIAALRMGALRRAGVAAPLERFLDRVAAEDGDLHVSLDADFLDPRLAPAVGTAVPGGATLEEAGRIAALLGESGRVTSLDLVELNPRLAAARRTAALLIALAADILPPCPEALLHTGS